jgi:hypothetical protein
MNKLPWQAFAASALCAAMAASVPAPALAASSGTAVANASPATPRIERTGTFVLDLDLTVSPDLPDGSLVTIYATASTFDADYSDTFELYGAQAKVADHKVSGTYDMPYIWLVATTADKVDVSISVSGTATKGELSYSDTSSFDETIPLPANGAKTPIHDAGSL